MIQVVLRMTAPPHRTPEMIRAFRLLEMGIRSATGLVSSRLYADIECPDALCYLEEWSTPEDFARQVVSVHYTRLLSLMEGAVEAPDLRVNNVLDVKGLEYLRELRLTRHGGEACSP